MNATEIRFYVPTKKTGYAVIVIALFPRMGTEKAGHLRAHVDGVASEPIECEVTCLHDAICCVRGMMEQVAQMHLRLDYPSMVERIEAINSAAMVVFLALQIPPKIRLIVPPSPPSPNGEN